MLILLGIAVLAGAAATFLIRRHSAALQAASVNWPTVDGVVERSWVASNTDKDGNITYTPRVTYTFQSGGAEHRSHRIAWGAQAQNALPNQAQETVARYPTGEKIKVYCNPKKPSQAVLDPNEKGGLTLLNILWIVLLVVGVGIIIGGFFMQS